MNRQNLRSKSARKARMQKANRMFAMAQSLIAVVAIIECIILISMTTFSWIESSSSLIISSGKNGAVSMNVANNTNYQVELSADAEGEADMNGYYRKVDHFHFALASSPDGVNFFFPKTTVSNSIYKSDGANAHYRAGDTTDYNISYTYFDFSIKNSTGIEKNFYFKKDSTANLFTVHGGTTEVNAAVKAAMRMSFEATTEGESPIKKVYSMTTGNVHTVAAIDGTLTSDAASNVLHTIAFDEAEYSEDDGGASRLFKVLYSGEETKVGVRIWLEEKALDTSVVNADVLKAVTVDVNMELISDDLIYDKIYFDDYGFSTESGAEGKHTTMTDKRMYFYAYSSQPGVNKYIAYQMALVTNPDNPSVPRWVTSAPVEYVFAHLTIGSPTHPAFFAYGDLPTARNSPVPDKVPMYRWNLPGALQVESEDVGEETVYLSLTDGYDMIAGFGATRSKATYTNVESIRGYSAFLNAVTPQLVRFVDSATAYTGQPYNASVTGDNPVYGYRYITQLTKSAPTTTVATNQYYYYDLPTTVKKIVITNNGQSGSNQTVDVDISSAADGACYYCNNTQDGGKQNCVKYDNAITCPSAADEGLTGVKRIYFWNNPDVSWTNTIRIYTMDNNTNEILPSNDWYNQLALETYPFTSFTSVENYNYTIFFAGSDSAEATAAVTPYYDSDTKQYLAYVPKGWLTGGLRIRFNSEGYYNRTTSKILWTAGALSEQAAENEPTYTALGYGDVDTVVASLSNAAGIGTWESTRKITFSTELIDSTIAPANAYTLSIDSGTTYYRMVPDEAKMTFSASIPTTCASVTFKQTISGDDTEWTVSNFTAEDKIYYPVSENRGYFHVAVLVDGTYEKLIQGIKDRIDSSLRDDVVSTLTATPIYWDGETENYELSDDHYYDLFAVDPESEEPIYRIDDTRWVVPCTANTTSVTYVWAPYDYTANNNNLEATISDTYFIYTQYLADGIYCVVTE